MTNSKALKDSLHSLMLAVLTISILLAGCKSDLEKQTAWDLNVLAPLVKGSLNIEDLVGDSLIQIDPDDRIRLVYESTLLNYNLIEESIQIPDTTLETFVSLDSLRLEDRSIIQPISLGQVLSQAGIIGQLVIGLNGSTAAIPAIGGLGADPTPLDATDFFESATIDSGYLDISVYNGFPIPLTDVQFKLSDPVSGAVILDNLFAEIPVADSVSVSVSLAGLTVNGFLEAEIVNVSTPGSSGEAVLIDTSDQLLIRASVRDIRVLEATAIFPAQDLVDSEQDILYDMGGPELTFMKIRSGNVKVFVVNTIQDSIFIYYKIPGAISPEGDVFEITTVVPPAPPDGNVIIDEKFDLAGYEVDLRGKDGLEYNTFYNVFRASIDSTGELVYISLDDSIQVIYGLENIIPDEIRGYAGQDEVDLNESSDDFSLFDQIRGGSLDLESVNVELLITNGIGVEGSVLINDFSASNQNNGTSSSLNAPGVVGVPIHVNRALDNPFIPGITSIKLNSVSSNIDELIELFPDRIDINAQLNVNPNGNNFGYQDFLVYESELDVSLNVDIPLSFIAQKLLLVDTLDFSLGGDAEDQSGVKDGTFTFKVDNGYPMTANMQMYFLDDNGLVIDSLFQETFSVESGLLDEDCKIAEPTLSQVEVFFDENRMAGIKKSDRVMVVSDFSSASSPGCEGYVKIYSGYDIQFKLIGDFNFEIRTDF